MHGHIAPWYSTAAAQPWLLQQALHFLSREQFGLCSELLITTTAAISSHWLFDHQVVHITLSVAQAAGSLVA